MAAIQHGTHHWIATSDPQQVRALMKGSMFLGSIYLTVAFTKQYHSIGWHQMYLGRVSNSWEKAYHAYSGRSPTEETASSWPVAFIMST